MTSSSKSENNPIFKSPAIFASLLGLFLWGIVLVLNWIGSSEVPVSVEQFRELQSERLLTHIEVTPLGLHGKLAKRVRVLSEGRELVTEQVFLKVGEGEVSENLESWNGSGVIIDYREEAQWSGEWGGILLVVVLLGIGVWHLWSQIQMDRTGIGSPRRRLQQLEDDLKAGKIEEEEYKKSAEVIWAEM